VLVKRGCAYDLSCVTVAYCLILVHLVIDNFSMKLVRRNGNSVVAEFMGRDIAQIYGISYHL
jgi:hypothetical protein